MEDLKQLTTQQVCELLQVTKQTLIRWEKQGKITPSYKSNRLKRWSEKEIKRFING